MSHYILVSAAGVLCKPAKPGDTCEWRQPETEDTASGGRCLLVPKDAMRYDTEHGAAAGVQIHGGAFVQID